MQIKNAKFITSITGNQPFLGKGLPEIAVSGKSNVGKSSFINCMCSNGKLARTSQEPGKTRMINVFGCGSFYLMDLPGYGYARVSDKMQRDWGRMMQEYLSESKELCHVIQLVDLRHDPTQADVQMMEYLRYYHIPYTIVATKADKLSRSARFAHVAQICRGIGVQPWQVVCFSSVNRTGKEEIEKRLDDILSSNRI